MCVCNVPLVHWYVFAERSTGFGAGASAGAGAGAGAGTGIFCKLWWQREWGWGFSLIGVFR